MIREIQGKIRARFEDSKEIPGAVDVIPNRVEPLGLSSFCGTRKEVRMEIREALSFYHSRFKYVTLQELLTNNTR